MKEHNQKISALRLTIAGVILLLSLFTLLKTGTIVTELYYGIYYLFGSITLFLLVLIMYCCIQYIVNPNYAFYRSKTFWSLILMLSSFWIFATKSFNLTETLKMYMDRLDNAYTLNGGLLGYFLVKPIYLFIGNFGLIIVSVILFAIGAFMLYTMFYEVELDFGTAKEKLTPKPKTIEEQRREREERKKQEALAQEEFEREQREAEVKKQELEEKRQKELEDSDPVAKMLNLRITKPKELEIREVKPDYQLFDEETEPNLEIIKEELPEEDELEIHEVDVTAETNRPKPKVKPQETKESDSKNNAHVNVMKIEKSVEKRARKSGKYNIPPIKLLSEGKKDLAALKRLEAAATENAKILEMTLESFNLKAKIINVSIGPNITKYELQPEIGTKVNKFSSLSNDLAMALAATSIRIEAPIPGKAAVGIEIPNKEILSVSLKEVLQSENNDMDKKLQVALGKDITGESIFMEINKTPHMLVAGATGSGKSVSINSFILSILLKSTPEEVKMIMIDPKKVELAPYNGIPHLLTPVVTEPKRAAVILKKMVLEMESRYELFSKTNTRNIEGFNTKLQKTNPDHFKELPYIVIIIDELADLMMVASNEVETSIARLAQMARAAGIHLVIATQRPSTDVITGLIKSNIPTRLSFSVSSSIDSRTILDQSGAEKLLGKGDMLYAANGSNNLNRIQGTFVSDEEIIEVVEFITEQGYGKEELEKQQAEFEATIEQTAEASDQDELFEEAVEIILAANSASTSLLQRRLRIGFNRASSIMEQMEEAGIVSANEGTKPRKILISSYGENNE